MNRDKDNFDMDATLTLSERERVRDLYERQAGLSPEPFLIGETPASREVRFLLAEGESTIGRAVECAVALPDPAVSLRHAIIVRSGASLLVRDLGSTNGTLLNEKAVAEAALRDGDVIRVGRCSLRVAIPHKAP